MTVTEVLEEARALSPTERIALIKGLVDLIAETTPSVEAKRSLRELRGLGKEIWTGIDAQTYFNEQRDEWDKRP
ncbi:MAG: hypothetical protein SF123_15825 [Chloroflexota bacterium]|nr:hypothetical protein [Chloroflexota bacterium]